MLDVKSLKIVRVEELKFGDLAMITELQGGLTMIGSVGDKKAVIPLSGPAPAFDWFYAQELDGTAILIEDTHIEVEPRSCGREKRGLGSLVRWHEHLMIEAGSSGRIGPVQIATGLSVVGPNKAYFPDWRIIKMRGDREQVIFEHTASQS